MRRSSSPATSVPGTRSEGSSEVRTDRTERVRATWSPGLRRCKHRDAIPVEAQRIAPEAIPRAHDSPSAFRASSSGPRSHARRDTPRFLVADRNGPESSTEVGVSSNRMRVEPKFGVLGRSDGGRARITPPDRRPPFVFQRSQASCRRPGRRSPGFPAQIWPCDACEMLSVRNGLIGSRAHHPRK